MHNTCISSVRTLQSRRGRAGDEDDEGVSQNDRSPEYLLLSFSYDFACHSPYKALTARCASAAATDDDHYDEEGGLDGCPFETRERRGKGGEL